ncbi:unnamed protein product [Heterobilharzia americana]|nr:unnamed protein product [Heterobilharzia americana]
MEKLWEDDRRVDITEEYLRRRDHGGKFGSRKSAASGNNMDIIKRAMSMSLISGSGASGVTAQNSGLAAGEVWVRITIVHGANRSMIDLQELISAIVGTQLRFYNAYVEGKNALMYAKIRQKEVSNYRKSLQNTRNPHEASQSCSSKSRPVFASEQTGCGSRFDRYFKTKSSTACCSQPIKSQFKSHKWHTPLSGLRDVAGLVELDLADTPLSTKFHPNDRSFADKLHKILPTIKRVNGEDLPQTVQFAIEQRYFPSDEVKIALLSFLKLYLNRYDTQPRGENLLPYYTTVSQLAFSVSPESRVPNAQNVSFTARVESTDKSGRPTTAYLTTSRLTQAYFSKSRNLLRCRDQTRRRDMIVRGSLAIASFLDELPATEHQLESLSVDVAFHSTTQMLFTMSGVFYEVLPVGSSTNSSNIPEKSVRKVLRCFTRTMILVAPGGHVVQDDYIVSNPSITLCKKYITEMAAKSRQPNEVPEQQLLAPSVSTPDVNEAIVTEFSQRTGMNIPYSKKCLEEFQWDANAAFNAFEIMSAAGQIPSEAFIA